MARGRTKGDHDARRIQIAEAACSVFVRLGLNRTTLADIAREMGCTTGVLQHYFADKDELLLFAKNRLFDAAHENARIVAEKATGLDKLRAMIAELLPSDPKTIDSYRLLAMFNGSAVGDPRLVKLQLKRNDSVAILFATLIAQLQEEGLLRKGLNPRLEAAGILALIDGLGDQQVMRSEPWSRNALNQLLDRYIDSLAGPELLARRRRAHKPSNLSRD